MKGKMHTQGLLLLEGLNVCECILQRQHWHYWLSLISIKKCSRGESDGREGASKRGRKSEERKRLWYEEQVKQNIGQKH